MEFSRRFPVLVLLLVAALLPTFPLDAQITLQGGDFKANAYTLNDQRNPRVGRASNGNFVVVWQSYDQASPSSDNDIFAQRYSSAGAALGAEFRVNSYSNAVQRRPDLTVLGNGDFIVVWDGIGTGGLNGTFFQRYASSGSPVGGDFRFSGDTMYSHQYPRVASDASGNFVVTWFDGSLGNRPVARRFNSSGTPLGAEFDVPVFTANFNFGRPAISMAPTGDFVIVWGGKDNGRTTDYEVFARRWTSAGTPLTADFQVNTYTTGKQYRPSVSHDSNGNFVVVWLDGYPQGYITGKRFNNIGGALGGEFRVNSTPGVDLRRMPQVSSDPAGNFVVAWASRGYPGDTTTYNIIGRLFNTNGTPRGAEFRVNTYSLNGQFNPVPAVDAAGNVVVVWEDQSRDGSGFGVYGQRVCPNLASNSIDIVGPTNVCPGATGGTLTVTDNGGGLNGHSWGYRTTSMGTTTAIAGQTGTTYVLNAGNTLPSGMALYIVCTTVPTCGSVAVSNEIGVFKGDVTGPSVTAPVPATVRQTLCQ